MNKNFTYSIFIMLVGSILFLSCGGTRQLAQSSTQATKKEIIASGANKENVTNTILDVMNTAGYRATSANPHLLIFVKDVTSPGGLAFMGHAKEVRVTFTIIDAKDSIKINGDIVGILTGSPGLLTSVHRGGYKRTVDLSNNERAQKHLTFLMEQIEAKLK